MKQAPVILEEETSQNDSGGRKRIMVLTTTLGIRPLLSFMKFPKAMQSSLSNDTTRLTLECDSTMRGLGINSVKIEHSKIYLDVRGFSSSDGAMNFSKVLIPTYLKALWLRLLIEEDLSISIIPKNSSDPLTFYCKYTTT